MRSDHEFCVAATRQPLKTRQNQLKEVALRNINCANSEEGSGKISIGTENNYGFPNSQTRSLSVSNLTIPSLYSTSKFQVKKDGKKKTVLVLLFLETSSLPKLRPHPYVILFFQIAILKAQLSSAGKPGGFAKLDQNGRLPQSVLTAGYDQYSAFDLAWQSVHMAAAAACRGSTPTGGSGSYDNRVMVRNTADKKTCSQICSQSSYPNCDGEVSVYGRERKATQDGEIVGSFYNYNCNSALNGGSEVSEVNEAIMSSSIYFSFCCCRK